MASEIPLKPESGSGDMDGTFFFGFFGFNSLESTSREAISDSVSLTLCGVAKKGRDLCDVLGRVTLQQLS
jgi:hypothetical protein